MFKFVDFASARSLWVMLFMCGIVLQVIFLNYINKAYLLTYELKSNVVLKFSSDQEVKLFQDRLALKAKQENTAFIFKSMNAASGSDLDAKRRASYRFTQSGYCNFRTCVSASNNFEPNTFSLAYYDNWLIDGSDQKSFDRFVEAIKP